MLPGRPNRSLPCTETTQTYVACGFQLDGGVRSQSRGRGSFTGLKESVPNPWAPTATCDTEFYHIKSDAYPDGGIYGPEMASAFDPENDNRRIIGYGTYVSAASGPTPGGNPEHASPRLRSMHHRLSCARALRPMHSAM